MVSLVVGDHNNYVTSCDIIGMLIIYGCGYYITKYTKLTRSSYDRTMELRSRKSIKYRQYVDIKLPRAYKIPKRSKTKRSTAEELFPVRIIESEDSGKRLKFHYVGYPSSFDEWREESDSENIYEPSEPSEQSNPSADCLFEPFSLNRNLLLKIKQSLGCGRKGSPEVKVVVPFHSIHFNGGIKLLGIPSKKVQGIQHYTINAYKDLNPLFGPNWHYRGLNANGDYGYIIPNTVHFYLRKCRPLREYLPTKNDDEELCTVSLVESGYHLNFCFVCGYGSALEKYFSLTLLTLILMVIMTMIQCA